MDELPEAMSLEAIQERLVAAAGRAALEVFDQRVMLDLSSLERTLLLSVAPVEWVKKDERRAEVAVAFTALHAALAADPERAYEEEDAELAIDVEYCLLGPEHELPLAALEASMKPLVEKVNAALGGEPRPVYYTVATDYAGSARAVEAKVLDGHVTSVLDTGLDLGFVEGVARALRAIGE
jgi:hypothetical protein